MGKGTRRPVLLPAPATLRTFDSKDAFLDLETLAAATGMDPGELERLTRAGEIHSIDIDGDILSTRKAVQTYGDRAHPADTAEQDCHR